MPAFRNLIRGSRSERNGPRASIHILKSVLGGTDEKLHDIQRRIGEEVQSLTHMP